MSVERYKHWAEVKDPICVHIVLVLTKDTVDEYHTNGVLTHNNDHETLDTLDVSTSLHA